MPCSLFRQLRGVLGAALVGAAIVTTNVAMATPASAVDGTSTVTLDTACSGFPTTTYPTISQGSSGTIVQRAQCLLNRSLNPNSFTPLQTDGGFGPLTASAVRSFQSCINIGVDGVIGPVTWAKLEAWANSSHYACPRTGATTACDQFPTTTYPTISQGSSGTIVQRAQCLLNQVLDPGSHTPLQTDGGFGRLTDSATRSFQSCVGIGVNGIIGPVTWAKLEAWANFFTTIFPCQ